MTTSTQLIIEPLQSRHNKADFECGIKQLNTYIQKQAGQDAKRRISRTFVATTVEIRNKIYGFYTLSSLSIGLTELPEAVSRKLPKHPIPAALLGRLAVSTDTQGKGIGQMLLADAIKRTLSISQDMAIYALVVDAINDDAQHFYEQFGFTTLSGTQRRLYLPLKSIKR